MFQPFPKRMGVGALANKQMSTRGIVRSQPCLDIEKCHQEFLQAFHIE